MGDFNKVTVGSGTLSVNGTDVGFLKGPVKVALGHEKLELKSGVPRKYGYILAKTVSLFSVYPPLLICK